jgi:MipA family protein
MNWNKMRIISALMVSVLVQPAMAQAGEAQEPKKQGSEESAQRPGGGGRPNERGANETGGRPASVFDGDYITLGIGAGYRPDYQGSDDYRVVPLPLITGSISGFDFGARGPGLYVDLIRDGDDGAKTSFVFGPNFRVRADRNGKIEDDIVRSLGKRDVAVELGINAEIARSGVLNRADKISFGIEVLQDVAGAHKGLLISPSVSYFSPLSNAAFVNLSISAQYADDKFNRYYFGIDTAGSAASGLPVFAAKGGIKNVGASLLGGYDLSGNALDGGWSLFGLANYNRLTGDAKKSPITSLRGSANQWFVGAGVGYTF